MERDRKTSKRLCHGDSKKGRDDRGDQDDHRKRVASGSAVKQSKKKKKVAKKKTKQQQQRRPSHDDSQFESSDSDDSSYYSLSDMDGNASNIRSSSTGPSATPPLLRTSFRSTATTTTADHIGRPAPQLNRSIGVVPNIPTSIANMFANTNRRFLWPSSAVSPSPPSIHREVPEESATNTSNNNARTRGYSLVPSGSQTASARSISPGILDGRWAQSHLISCRRLVPPRFIAFNSLSPEGDRYVLRSSSLVSVPNTLVIEGHIDAALRFNTTRGSYELEIKNGPEPSILFVTQSRGRDVSNDVHDVHDACTDPYAHYFQAYQHCDLCRDETLATDSELPPLPQAFATMRYKQPKNWYNVLHISRSAPICADTWLEGPDYFFSKRLEVPASSHVAIEFLHRGDNNEESKIELIDLLRQASLDIEQPPTVFRGLPVKDVINIKRLVVNLRNSSKLEMVGGGLLKEMWVACRTGSVVNGGDVTCDNLLAICTGNNSLIQKCTPLGIFESFVADRGRVDVDHTSPEIQIYRNSMAANGRWITTEEPAPRHSTAAAAAAASSSVAAAAADVAVSGVDTDDSDSDSGWQSIPIPGISPVLAHMFAAMQREHRSRYAGLLSTATRIDGAAQTRSGLHLPLHDPIEGIIRQSFNEYRPAPANPITNDMSHGLASRPAKPEDQEVAPDKERTCCICLIYKSTHLVVPCGHRLSCTDCSHEMCNPDKKLSAECPLCRTPIKGFVWIRE